MNWYTLYVNNVIVSCCQDTTLVGALSQFTASHGQLSHTSCRVRKLF